jgi:hypothetical protein
MAEVVLRQLGQLAVSVHARGPVAGSCRLLCLAAMCQQEDGTQQHGPYHGYLIG